MSSIHSSRLLLALLIFTWATSTPIVASAKTLICSKYTYFNAQTLKNFRKTEDVSDWVEGNDIPDDVDRIIIALPKSEALEKFGCVDQAEILVPGVKDALLETYASVGAPSILQKTVPIEDFLPGYSFGVDTNTSQYIRSSSVTVRVIISIQDEPFRSFFAFTTYFDLPLDYCETHDNCGIQVGDD